MNPTLIAWFETIFNILYLIAIWSIVYLMIKSMASVKPEDRRVADLIRLAFIMLAAGDTGHVGFRVLSTLLGGAGTEAMILGTPMSLIGLGMLITSYTVTFFYMLFVYVWKARYNQSGGWLPTLLLTAGIVRLIFMALPGNEWGNSVPPHPMSLYRNIPLMIQGVGLLGLIFHHAYKTDDTTFKRIGWMIIVSFAFYIPVILFARQIPLIGMLMIPKTVAYLAIAWIAYRGLWGRTKNDTQ
ncbi:MAG: hypothetical protein K8R40_06630 [Anaerolineaceae bacterium]|nr:hypothetical protein [Anaerolineaceae bacterium]